MFDWNDLRYFLAVTRAGTLARAARESGANATTVGRRIGALEELVGARLFDRTPTGFTLSPAGRDLLPHAERVEREVLAATRVVAGADERIEGPVRLATTETLATRFLAPHLERFHRRHPGLTLEILCSLRTVELARREADVALRLTRPREPDVVARPLTTIDLGLYAARRYLDARPLAPRQPPSLAGHAAILFSATPAFAIENQWLQPLLAGAQVVLRADSVSAIYAACVGGVGIALLPRRVADTDPTLVPIGSAGAPEPRTVWQGVHRDLMKNARVRAVTSFLAEVVARAVDEGSERRTPA